jgi:hypothetical protein
MSKLGHITKSYGNQLNFAIANTNGDNIMNSILPPNTIILNSQIDKYNNDTNVTSMFITDIEGTPVRLTYTIVPGNGLIAHNDKVSLNVNNNIFKTNNGKLSINLQNLIDKDTLIIKNNKIQINTNNLNLATSGSLGLIRIDNFTLKIDNNNELYVATENLDKATNNTFGVCKPDNKTIKVLNNCGVIGIPKDAELTFVSNNNYGVCKPDNDTIISKDGVLSVVTDNLKHSTIISKGVTKIDNNTLKILDNGSMYVDVNNLPQSSDVTFGTVKCDNTSIVINNGIASIKDFNDISSTINSYSTILTTLENKINELSSFITNNSVNKTSPIHSLSFRDATATLLNPPKYLEEPVDMPIQFVTVNMNVITSCDFNVSVDIINNIAPAIEIYQINYNDINTYDYQVGKQQTFSSTNKKQCKMSIQFGCKNYKNMNSTAETATTQIKIKFTDDSNINNFKQLNYSIIRHNSFAIEPDDYIVTYQTDSDNKKPQGLDNQVEVIAAHDGTSDNFTDTYKHMMMFSDDSPYSTGDTCWIENL